MEAQTAPGVRSVRDAEGRPCVGPGPHGQFRAMEVQELAGNGSSHLHGRDRAKNPRGQWHQGPPDLETHHMHVHQGRLFRPLPTIALTPDFKAGCTDLFTAPAVYTSFSIAESFSCPCPYNISCSCPFPDELLLPSACFSGFVIL